MQNIETTHSFYGWGKALVKVKQKISVFLSIIVLSKASVKQMTKASLAAGKIHLRPCDI